MYTQKQCQEEIAVIVERKLAKNEAVSAEKVTFEQIYNHHPDFKRGEDFGAWTDWAATRQVVGSYLARMFKDDDGDRRQLVMNGFEHLQRYYIVERNQEDFAMPTERLTHDERIMIGNRLMKEGETKIAHAMEMFEFDRKQCIKESEKIKIEEEEGV